MKINKMHSLSLSALTAVLALGVAGLTPTYAGDTPSVVIESL